jgi:large subunit ribosomal protein L30
MVKAKAKKSAAAGTMKVKMIGSLIGCTVSQRETVRGLGLRRMHQIVERQDTKEIRGMVNAVPHLVAIVK